MLEAQKAQGNFCEGRLKAKISSMNVLLSVEIAQSTTTVGFTENEKHIVHAN